MIRLSWLRATTAAFVLLGLALGVDLSESRAQRPHEKASRNLSAQKEKAPEVMLSESSHGTLIIALATPKYIVVATDSRRTFESGYVDDLGKKLFRVGNDRVLAIAGFAGTTLRGLPTLSAQIPSLIEEELAISFFKDIDDAAWNRPSTGASKPDRNSILPDPNPYHWWSGLVGPMQSILNIHSTFDEFSPNKYFFQGILAGFTADGRAKLERLLMLPVKGKSSWGLPSYGLQQVVNPIDTTGQMISMTAGKPDLADSILAGNIPELLKDKVQDFPAIFTFFKRHKAGADSQMSEQDAVALAKELIRATALQEKTVGSEPIQVAILRLGKEVEIHQPDFPRTPSTLTISGSWNLGWIFNPDHPFDSKMRRAVFTFCITKDNKHPIPLGENHFYGNTFERTTFVYRGGFVSFGDNNHITESTLLIARGVDEEPLRPILHHFSKVERLPDE